ncbi:uncharacterized PPE family protein PPE40-like isoform X2 [Leptidea sinapis]|uniref:uncharacterized PPE family protein PPE40-like isoform X2 n=1 Tax=Leptidea sinapis TaxID=189913 RepID=UPI0021C44956|nr:uncharacterized PPE family protein PPE40-like isoform X2 [Leptidea sinapis]
MILKNICVLLFGVILINKIDAARTTEKDPYNTQGYQQGYNTQQQNGYGPADDPYNYNSHSSKHNVVTGRIPAGQPINIGNGRGNTNIVAITDADPNTDVYIGHKNSGDRGNNGYANDGYGNNGYGNDGYGNNGNGNNGYKNDGYDSTDRLQGPNSGILVTKRKDGTDNVYLYNKNTKPKGGNNNIVVINENRNGDADFVALQGGGRSGESYIAISNNPNKHQRPSHNEQSKLSSRSGYYGESQYRY